RGTAEQFFHLRRFATRVVAARRLFREALAVAARFPGHGLVAANARRSRQRPLGGTGFPVLTRAAFAPHGTVRACQYEPVRSSGGSRAGTKANPRTGTLALPSQTGSPGFAASNLARHLPAPAGHRASVTVSPGCSISSDASTHGRK